MQADAALTGTARSTLATLRVVLAEDGVRGLWRGTDPTVLRLSAGVGVNMVILERLKAAALQHLVGGGAQQLGMLQAALVGGEVVVVVAVVPRCWAFFAGARGCVLVFFM